MRCPLPFRSHGPTHFAEYIKFPKPKQKYIEEKIKKEKGNDFNQLLILIKEM
jgi:hypothetical protein